MVPQVPKLGAASKFGDWTTGRVSRRVSRATLTGDSPSTHPAREVGMLRRHRGGWVWRWARCRFELFFPAKLFSVLGMGWDAPGNG